MVHPAKTIPIIAFCIFSVWVDSRTCERVISLTRYFWVLFLADAYSVLILLFNMRAVQEGGPESSICRVTVLKFFG